MDKYYLMLIVRVVCIVLFMHCFYVTIQYKREKQSRRLITNFSPFISEEKINVVNDIAGACDVMKSLIHSTCFFYSDLRKYLV